jgi:hypothetical protein
MWWSSRSELRRAALAAALALPSCAGSATAAFLRESDPLVRLHERIRDELAARDAARGLAPQGGCPVCRW